jgi:predicted regulator of Ras-like GTPase activity (Roadblock/LC7/MglB family)
MLSSSENGKGDWGLAPSPLREEHVVASASELFAASEADDEEFKPRSLRELGRALRQARTDVLGDESVLVAQHDGAPVRRQLDTKLLPDQPGRVRVPDGGHNSVRLMYEEPGLRKAYTTEDDTARSAIRR